MKQPKSREEIEAFAAGQNGKLRSTGRVAMQRMALWECKDGHVFKMTPNNVKYGHWCPTCWRISRKRKTESTADGRFRLE